MQLTREQQEKARAYLYTQARPVEAALYACIFEGASNDAVVAALVPYQNPDGGFGHGFEPDFRLDASSALCTTFALQTLTATQAPATLPMVQHALRYFCQSYDPALAAWPLIPAHDNTAPRAPWWNYSDETQKSCADYRANPRAEILGYFLRYGEGDAPEWLMPLLQYVIGYFAEQPVEKSRDDELNCAMILVDSPNLPGSQRAALLSTLLPIAAQQVQRTPDAWTNYGLQPYQIAASPASPFLPAVADLIDANLDYLITRQGDDGAWQLTWSWFGQYPDVWPTAEREWKGILTLSILRTLRNFDRLA
ncbi:MAG: hypothetical protein ACYC6A_03125 [Armatimonadota bacterium]